MCEIMTCVAAVSQSESRTSIERIPEVQLALQCPQWIKMDTLVHFTPDSMVRITSTTT